MHCLRSMLTLGTAFSRGGRCGRRCALHRCSGAAGGERHFRHCRCGDRGKAAVSSASRRDWPRSTLEPRTYSSTTFGGRWRPQISPTASWTVCGVAITWSSPHWRWSTASKPWTRRAPSRKRWIGRRSATTVGSRPFTRVSGTRRRAACTTSWTASRRGDRRRAVRPNQIFAVGGLPFALVEGERARRVVDTVEAALATPAGLRSCPGGSALPGTEDSAGGPRVATAPTTRGPCGRVCRCLRGRVGAGAEASESASPRRATGSRSAPALSTRQAWPRHHEIADGDPPHTPRGCPFQAWSVGEVLRIDRVILAPGD